MSAWTPLKIPPKENASRRYAPPGFTLLGKGRLNPPAAYKRKRALMANCPVVAVLMRSKSHRPPKSNSWYFNDSGMLSGTASNQLYAVRDEYLEKYPELTDYFDPLTEEEYKEWEVPTWLE